jgi:hypothetical protein
VHPYDPSYLIIFLGLNGIKLIVRIYIYKRYQDYSIKKKLNSSF